MKKETVKFHFEILDEQRKKLLPLFRKFKDRFYLAGGTGLALQLVHRDSIDFDFFTPEEFSAEALLREVRRVFSGHDIEVVQAGNMTLNLIIDQDIKASFFCVKDKLIKPTHDLGDINVASISDIACMKMAALTRAQFKDYVDLYYIFKQSPLDEVAGNCRKKYHAFEELVYLKALTSFDDISKTDILFIKGKKISIEEIQKDFFRRVREYLKKPLGGN